MHVHVAVCCNSTTLECKSCPLESTCIQSYDTIAITCSVNQIKFILNGSYLSDTHSGHSMLAVLKKCGMCNVVIFLLLLAFTIGLNLGIHGALHFEVARGPGDVTSSNIGIVSSSATRPSPATMSIGLNLPTGSGNDPNLTTKNDNDPNLTTKNDNVPNVAITGSNSNYAHSPTKEPPFITRKERHGEAPVKPVQELTSPPILSIGKLGNIESYLAGGGKFPILLITCNRPDLLKITLNSLLSVIGVSASNILVVQDGSMEAVSEVVKNRGIQVVQNTRGIGLRGGAGSDGASRIASHYKFALTTAFQAFPESPGVIIVEDDLLFSPDFFEYFHAVSPILDHDKTVFALSAWSDNGFIGRVKDPYKLERTDYFPGLGWLISKELYTTELEPQWPSAHWDHWLRSEHINKNREIVHPEVPRTFHNGIKGTFMDLTMHNLYFRDIAYNINPEVSWSRHQSELGQPVYKAVIAENFESEVLAQVERCVHTKSVDEIISAPGSIYTDMALSVIFI